MWFDVAVDQTGSVRITNTCAGLYHQGNGFVNGEAPMLPDGGFEVNPGDVFHDDVQAALVQAKIVYGDDVGMRKVGGGSGLLAKPLTKPAIL